MLSLKMAINRDKHYKGPPLEIGQQRWLTDVPREIFFFERDVHIEIEARPKEIHNFSI